MELTEGDLKDMLPGKVGVVRKLTVLLREINMVNICIQICIINCDLHARCFCVVF